MNGSKAPARPDRWMIASLSTWLIFAVLPALAINPPVSSRADRIRLVTRWYGEEAAPYLAEAPSALLLFVLVASFAAPLAASLTFQRLRRLGADRPVHFLRAAASQVAVNSAVFFASALLVAGASSLRAGGWELNSSWGARLGLFGIAAELPYVAVAIACAALFRRVLPGLLVTWAAFLALAVCGAGPNLSAHFPWAPGVLAGHLYSGRDDNERAALAGVFVWLMSGLTTAVLVVWARSRKSSGVEIRR